MKWFFDLIMTLFSPATWKTYSLGREVFRAPEGWKLSCLANTRNGLFIGIYRCHDIRPPMGTKMYRNGDLIHTGPDETVGQACECAAMTFWVGERGNVYALHTNVETCRKIDYATHIAMHNGRACVFDTHKDKINVWNVLDDTHVCELPGHGIVTASAEADDGTIIAAVIDGDRTGYAGSDGQMIDAKGTQCLAKYNGILFGTRGNEVVRVEWDKQRLMLDEVLPCFKVMNLDTHDGLLWAATANPDALWCRNRMGSWNRVAEIKNDKPVGGSVFHSRTTSGYFGHCEHNRTAVVYSVKEGE